MSTAVDIKNGARNWVAQLDLELALREESTVVASARHVGPLRIQNAFPQPDGSCHVYLLHPPGGLVGGDQLSISIHAGNGSSALLTTPSAGKFYGCLEGLDQKQRIDISVAESARLEWLPQENIYFDGARSDLETTVNIESSGLFIGWEIHCLGRRAMGETFADGSMNQRLRVYREGKLLHRERLTVLPASLLATSKWGLGSNSVIGTLIASLPADLVAAKSRRIQEKLVELNALQPQQSWGFSLKDSMILGRYLGDSVETCRAGLTQMRLKLSSAEICGSASIPRIWNT